MKCYILKLFNLASSEINVSMSPSGLDAHVHGNSKAENGNADLLQGKLP
jgi:hypothetical protein